MEGLLSLAVKAVFVENLALSFFLGMCTFIAVSKKISTALGLGISVMLVQAITVPTNNLLLTYLLAPGALAWAGFPNVDLTFPWSDLLHRRDCGDGTDPRDGAR